VKESIKNKWDKIVNRGPVLLPSFEHARSASGLYGVVDGELNFDESLGYMPNTYYDKRFADWPYYSFSAWTPVADEVGLFTYTVFDEDDGTCDDSTVGVEVSPELFDEFLKFKTEEEFLKEVAE